METDEARDFFSVSTRIFSCRMGNRCFSCPKHLSIITRSLVNSRLYNLCSAVSAILKGVMSQGAITYPESPNKTALALFHFIYQNSSISESRVQILAKKHPHL
ncbi:unnamed protein product [Acanthoscelides obtectus]|uniref:Uncharacterized protein n=1 Tax=Acanthoscelides obtectus TaxID=200917 RepID=A0A9P0PGC5_ACAOB|nr:unnamed protein product [Acanthoscelides obtectus]CAK1643481.1 hypothetical protein AOBTE_LOCUS13544 [Acanthoscelides obtectus]